GTLECTPLKVSGSNPPGATSCVGPVHIEQKFWLQLGPLLVDGGIGVPQISRLVDSRDIVELKLKQLNCEVLIRKKEAMPQPEYAPQPAVVYSPPSQTAPPVVPSHTQAPRTPSPSTSPLALKPPKSSRPPLKSPMAGTFYRSPGPAEPPFVK
ncbi:biotin carboxyl carrier protein of acetyl-CoA carboxylase chloroplastic-like, partial [Trifolium medium]|nr:biotin carboxyl carrier protein of acetyl-CoA carboxylase chloroplastic-like [Trifolium medium]